jgi:SNF2 family DNA or RNA helicase
MSKPYTPHPFQEKAIGFLLQRGGAALFATPGSGKTSCVLAAQTVLLQEAKGGPMLVVAPLRVAQFVWTDEVGKWADFSHLKVAVLNGKKRERYMKRGYDVYVINYELLEWFLDNGGIEKTGVTTLVCDESTKLKNPTGKRFKKLKGHLSRFDRRWILTGTPTPNGREDLWAQAYIVDGGLALGRYVTHFRDKYFYTDYSGFNRKLMIGAGERIDAAIKPFTMVVDGADYLQLPELVTNDIWVELPPAARKHYNELKNQFITMFDDATVTAANKAVALGKCLQVCNGALYTNNPEFVSIHDEKIDALKDLIGGMGGSAPLIFYQFRHDLARIQDALHYLPHIGSGVSATDTRMLIDAFNSDKLPGLLSHAASVGHGLQLQGAARHIVFFGLSHDLELYTQPIARVWRQGNPNERVFVHRILARNTFDEVVAKTLEDKSATMSSVMQACREQQDNEHE